MTDTMEETEWVYRGFDCRIKHLHIGTVASVRFGYDWIRVWDVDDGPVEKADVEEIVDEIIETVVQEYSSHVDADDSDDDPWDPNPNPNPYPNPRPSPGPVPQPDDPEPLIGPYWQLLWSTSGETWIEEDVQEFMDRY
jgi:hypothetical protein